MPAARKRKGRDRGDAKMKEAYGSDCARLYFGLLCIISLLVAVSLYCSAHSLWDPPCPFVN